MTIKETLFWAEKTLESHLEQPRFEAELLLAHHLQKERTYLHMYDEVEVSHLKSYKKLIERRVKHEPYEYIVGKANFYDIELSVTKHVLIPRPETELLVEKVITLIQTHNIKRIVEVGVGSGAISIVLARHFKTLQIVATDISVDAITVAQKNIEKYGLEEQIKLRETSLLEGVEENFDLVVSNPPYIAQEAPLEKNVLHYEPHVALFGGKEGDELLKKLMVDAQTKKAKFLCCEMGYDQKVSLERFVQHHFINEFNVKYIDFYQDYAGLDRGFILKY
jgi:release factor glutamine methyltransferase